MRIAGIPYLQGINAYTDRDSAKYGIAIHNTSNTASDSAEASYATRRDDGVSAHVYADGDSAIQSLDTNSRAGHAGSGEGNENAVAVEITGLNGWTRQQWLDRVAWNILGAALAQVVRHYGIAVRRASVAEMKANPKVKAFYSHNDMRLAWGGTDHDDPGPNFPWDRLFQAVNAALNGGSSMLDNTDPSYQDLIFRVAALVQGTDVLGGPHKGERNEVAANFRSLSAQVTALANVVATIATAVNEGGGNLDTAAILAAVDRAGQEARDAVADGLEGGASKVREDA